MEAVPPFPPRPGGNEATCRMEREAAYPGAAKEPGREPDPEEADVPARDLDWLDPLDESELDALRLAWAIRLFRSGKVKRVPSMVVAYAMAGSPREPDAILAALAPERQGPPQSGHASRSGTVHSRYFIFMAKLCFISTLLLVTMAKHSL